MDNGLALHFLVVDGYIRKMFSLSSGASLAILRSRLLRRCGQMRLAIVLAIVIRRRQTRPAKVAAFYLESQLMLQPLIARSSPYYRQAVSTPFRASENRLTPDSCYYVFRNLLLTVEFYRMCALGSSAASVIYAVYTCLV